MAARALPSIIIADNNAFYRQVLGDFYREIGYEARVAEDGLQAVEMLRERRCDLLLLDLIMPRLDGARLCALVKSHAAYQDLPVIILSGILADEIEGLESIRADAYVAKMPIDQIREALEEISAALLNGRPTRERMVFGFEKMYRREVVLELLQERKSSREILDSISEGIVELSGERRLLKTNRAFEQIAGLPASGLLSRPLEEIFPQSRTVLLSLFEDLARGSPMACAILHHQDREIQAKLYRFDPDRADDGGVGAGGPAAQGGVREAVRQAARTNAKVQLQSMIASAGYILVMEDITQRARAEREGEQLRARLAQSEKMSAIGMVVSGAAHELNNPLTSVLGYAQLLSHKHRGSGLQRDLDKIAAGAARCKEIVESLTAFARSHRPEKTAIQVNVLLNEALAGHRDRLHEAGVGIDLELAPGLPETLADPAQLGQAFSRILDNAVKAMAGMPGRRRITVSSRCEAERLFIQFADSGPGVPQEILGRVFEPFFTTRQVGQGKGLGLSFAYGIVAVHGGRIGVRNRPEGGAIVAIELPVVARGGVAGESVQPARREDSARHRILIVDDETVVQELLVDILEEGPYRLDTACNGIEGLRKIQEGIYDVVILDLKMPDMTGQQMYQQLVRHHPDLLGRILFITADTLTPEVQEFLLGAGSPCLTKPFAVESVLAGVRSILENQPRAAR